jgi:hypothetical protein
MEAIREAKTREVAIVMDIDYRGDGRKKEKERGEMDFSGRKKLGNYGRRPPQDINTLRPNFRPSASCSVLVRSVGKKPYSVRGLRSISFANHAARNAGGDVLVSFYHSYVYCRVSRVQSESTKTKAEDGS